MTLEQLVPIPPDTTRHEVTLLRWPAQQGQRERLEQDRLPRLLLIARACPAPVCVDELEDWVREPLHADEIEARAATLRRRARTRALRPRVDSSGLVRSGRHWVHLPPVQLPVAELLIERFGRVVGAEEIEAVYREAGGSLHPKAVQAMIGRVRLRLAALDLVLVNVRDRGYLLEAARHPPEPDPLQKNVQEQTASRSRPLAMSAP